MTRSPLRHLRNETIQRALELSAPPECACGEPIPRVIASVDDLTTVGKVVLVECKNPHCYAPSKVKIERPG